MLVGVLAQTGPETVRRLSGAELRELAKELVETPEVDVSGGDGAAALGRVLDAAGKAVVDALARQASVENAAEAAEVLGCHTAAYTAMGKAAAVAPVSLARPQHRHHPRVLVRLQALLPPLPRMPGSIRGSRTTPPRPPSSRSPFSSPPSSSSS